MLTSFSMLVVLALAASILLFIIYSDIRHRLIPNSAVVILAALFIPLPFLTSIDLIGHLLVFLLTFAATFICFHYKWLGGGDAKLIPVIALWAGPQGIMPFLLGMTLGGVLVAIVLIVMHARHAKGANSWRTLKLPYGVAIALAAMVVIGIQYGHPAISALQAGA